MAAETEVQKELKSNPEYRAGAHGSGRASLTQRGQIKPATETYIDVLRRLPGFRAGAEARCYVICPRPIDHRCRL